MLEHARLLFVCVDTPPTYSGDADLSRVYAVINELPPTGDHAIVMKSTVPVGTGASIRRQLAELGKTGLAYVSNPEFLKEGSAVDDFMHPDRVVVGADPDSVWAGDAVVAALRAARLPDRAHRRRLRRDDQARFERLPGNQDLLHQRDRQRLRGGRRGRRARSRSAWGSTRASAPSFLNAGIGYGGSCFPKDVSALKQLAGNSGYHFQLLTSVIEVNELQKRRVVSKLKKHLGSLVGKKIALLGLAFKPNTDDMREASSVVLAARLQGEGARVRAYDPVAEERARELITGAQMCDSRARRARRRGRRGDRDRVARVRRAGPAGGQAAAWRAP